MNPATHALVERRPPLGDSREHHQQKIQLLWLVALRVRLVHAFDVVHRRAERRAYVPPHLLVVRTDWQKCCLRVEQFQFHPETPNLDWRVVLVQIVMADRLLLASLRLRRPAWV